MEINCPICGDFHDFKRLLICDYLFTNVINKRLNPIQIEDNYIINNSITLNKQYKCFNCDKVLSSKQNLDNHLLNGVCTKFNNFKCMNCNKIFTTKQRLNYHISNNVCEELENKDSNLNKQNPKNKNINNGNIHNGNQNIQTNIGTLNINLNANTNQIQDMAEMLPFRDASYKIPTKKYLEYVNNPDQAIKQFVKDYHLNPNKPERQNILNTNRRDNRVQLFDFDEDFICRWQTKDKSKVLELLCDRGVNALFFAKTMLSAAGIKLDPTKETELNAKIKEYESSDKVKKKYIDMIGDLTYDYRDMVETNKKKYDGLICKN